MKWAICRVSVYSPTNKKQKEFTTWAENWCNSLLPTDIDKDAFVNEVHYHTKILNERFPKTKPLRVNVYGDKQIQIRIDTDEMHSVAIFELIPLIKEFKFSEKKNMLQEQLTYKKEIPDEDQQYTIINGKTLKS